METEVFCVVSESGGHNTTCVYNLVRDGIVVSDSRFDDGDNASTLRGGVGRGDDEMVREEGLEAFDKVVRGEAGVLKANDIMRGEEKSKVDENFSKSTGNSPSLVNAEGVNVTRGNRWQCHTRKAAGWDTDILTHNGLPPSSGGSVSVLTLV